MTDISDLREGDEIDVTIRYTVVRVMDVLAARHGTEESSNLRYLLNVAESVRVIQPEIVPGKLYVDADDRGYVGAKGGVVHELIARDFVYGPGLRYPLPPGLRPARLVAE